MSAPLRDPSPTRLGQVVGGGGRKGGGEGVHYRVGPRPTFRWWATELPWRGGRYHSGKPGRTPRVRRSPGRDPWTGPKGRCLTTSARPPEGRPRRGETRSQKAVPYNRNWRGSWVLRAQFSTPAGKERLSGKVGTGSQMPRNRTPLKQQLTTSPRGLNRGSVGVETHGPSREERKRGGGVRVRLRLRDRPRDLFLLPVRRGTCGSCGRQTSGGRRRRRHGRRPFL